MEQWYRREGSPHPFGVTFLADSAAYNFAIYAKHATGVRLELFSRVDVHNPVHVYPFDPAINKSSRVWHCRLPADLVDQADYYGYRIEGPLEPHNGHRYDSQKLLLDPYARGVHFPPGHSRQLARQPGDTAGRAPLGVLRPETQPFDWGDDRRPRHGHDAVIYEMHVRGFTRRENSGVAPDRRGTFLGVIDKIPYLQALGVNVVELLPVFQFDPGEGNYWGYMTLNFFSPHHLFAGEADNAVREFKTMVRALHAADIEVVLDVVYNHTTEGGIDGPTYSYRGIDNTTYYLLQEDRSQYHNDTGTGNVLHTANRYVRSFVLDSLRYWAQEMHVDGFRFDLASIFTRRSDGSIDLEDPPIIAAIRSDPLLGDMRLIAEAWDLASYQLGRNFPGFTWKQWNGRFRDDIRSIVKSDADMVSALATRLYGSDDLFPDNLADAYHAYQSVNFVNAHDGFCLYDLVSYDQKHNTGSGGGTDDNRSWNCGWEGDQGVPPEVLALRLRQMKNFCSLLLLSNGTPMFVAGDEFGNTQQGNNNPYNQDNELSWLDWDKLPENTELFRFFSTLIAFRKTHPTLSRSRHWRESVRWYGTTGDPDWGYHSRSLAYFLNGEPENDVDLYVMINTWWQPLGFTVQEGIPGQWFRLLDTNLASPGDIVAPGQEQALTGAEYQVGPRSVVALFRNRSHG